MFKIPSRDSVPISTPDLESSNFPNILSVILELPEKGQEIRKFEKCDSGSDVYQRPIIQPQPLQTEIKENYRAEKKKKKKLEKTTIRIRIPDRMEKKQQIIYDEEEEEDCNDSDEFTLTKNSPFFSKDSFPKSSSNSLEQTGLKYPRAASKLQIIKRVRTPDWEASANNDPNRKKGKKQSTTSGEGKDFKRFNMKREHSKLEVYENRIISGYEGGYIHPAQSLEAAKIGVFPMLSSDESMKQRNYEMDIPRRVVPRFWVPRMWDRSENVLSEEESRVLDIEIQRCASALLNKKSLSGQKTSKRAKKANSSKITKAREPKDDIFERDRIDISVMHFPLGFYKTDDEYSDWEDNI